MANIWYCSSSPSPSSNLNNNRAIAYDKNIYEKPEIFNPDRYFEKDGKLSTEGIHSEVWSFGFGRRYVHISFDVVLSSLLITQFSASALVVSWLSTR